MTMLALRHENASFVTSLEEGWTGVAERAVAYTNYTKLQITHLAAQKL
jgi:hypothetical protein